MRQIFLLFLLMISFSVLSQNMVLNPSFEDHKTNAKMFEYGDFKNITHWDKSCCFPNNPCPIGFCENEPLHASSDKIIGMTVGPKAHSGDYCAGIYVGAILAAELNSCMKKDSTYSISFYYKWNDKSNNYALKFSFYLVPDSSFYMDNGKTKYRPEKELYDDRLLRYDVDCDSCKYKGSWHKFTYTYNAHGGEKYLLFGVRINRFINGQWVNHYAQGPASIDRNTGRISDPRPLYYLIDDVSVVSSKSIIKTGTTINVYDILFDVNSSIIMPVSYSYLDNLARYLNGHPAFKIEITGHTDNTGSEADNMTLSLQRAESVKTYLISKGVRSDHISVYGMGESKPLASNETPEDRAKNRRISIIIKIK